MPSDGLEAGGGISIAGAGTGEDRCWDNAVWWEAEESWLGPRRGGGDESNMQVDVLLLTASISEA